jgi:uncharacterized protein (DUF433 family)
MTDIHTPLINKSDDTLSGIPVFYGTRVPVQSLIDYLSTGESMDTFLGDFPTVTREQVVRFLEEAGHLVIAEANEDSDR